MKTKIYNLVTNTGETVRLSTTVDCVLIVKVN